MPRKSDHNPSAPAAGAVKPPRMLTRVEASPADEGNARLGRGHTPANLNLTNRPVRTRMPGGVGGEELQGSPLSRLAAQQAHWAVGSARPGMRDIYKMGERAGALLKARGEKIAIGETSAGGLISASLLAVPGASAYFAGGAITYSKRSITGLAGISIDEMRARGIRSSSEPYAEMLAEAIRQRNGGVTWGLSETGAAGPGRNGYGDASGHTCMAVAGPVRIVRTLETGLEDRVENMWLFAEATLALLVEVLEAAPRPA